MPLSHNYCELKVSERFSSKALVIILVITAVIPTYVCGITERCNIGSDNCIWEAKDCCGAAPQGLIQVCSLYILRLVSASCLPGGFCSVTSMFLGKRVLSPFAVD